MEKIVCDICGTSYPETAAQCPLCGYAKPAVAVKTPDEDGSGAYHRVKGGRFSAANVRRRNEEKGVPMPPQPEDDEEEAPVRRGSNMVLGIIAIILLLCFIAVLLWFIIDIAGERFAQLDTIPAQTTQQQTELQVQPQEIYLEESGATAIVQASVIPVDMDMFFTFASADESIVTVDEFGTVTAVAEGETYITVTNGELSKQIPVTCVFTAPTETTAPKAAFSLNREDITLDKKGATWDLFGTDVTVAKNQVTWSSDDETIAKIENGVVEAVGPGTTKVHGQYEDLTISCIVRCSFEEETTEPTQTTGGTYKISHTDVTIKVGESFRLQLRDENKKAVEVTWAASEEEVVTIDGNKVTGAKAGKKITVSTTYEGKTYECVIRVVK